MRNNSLSLSTVSFFLSCSYLQENIVFYETVNCYYYHNQSPPAMPPENMGWSNTVFGEQPENCTTWANEIGWYRSQGAALNGPTLTCVVERHLLTDKKQEELWIFGSSLCYIVFVSDSRDTEATGLWAAHTGWGKKFCTNFSWLVLEHWNANTTWSDTVFRE